MTIALDGNWVYLNSELCLSERFLGTVNNRVGKLQGECEFENQHMISRAKGGGRGEGVLEPPPGYTANTLPPTLIS